MLAPLTCYALGVLAVATPDRTNRRLPSWLALVGALVGVIVALDALLGHTVGNLTGWRVLPGAQLSWRLDALAAFFLLVISLPGLAAAWYGLGYLDAAHDGQPASSRAGTDAGLNVFLASMTLVVLADSIIGFLIAWELMSLTSFFLVIGDGRRPDARRAGYIYVVMTHVGTGFLILAFMALARHSGSLDFAALRGGAATLGHWERDAIFLLALLGFGTKAGLVPLHVWLPRAHPAAPSHVSALMSGVMVKLAIYGLIRFVFEFSGPGPSWWGGLLLALGAVSAVLGILYALMERDLKRVLAYSTVEHMGILTLGLGAATLLDARGHDSAAALALLATLTHLLNHAMFKSLLFLGAGAIQTATGTRDLERLGGLARRMPRTSVLVLVGAVAIVALPPLNGFAGEWVLFQALLRMGFEVGTTPIATGAALAAGALALTGALALACFVRVIGVAFLAMPRSDAARDAHEVGITLQAPMALLALCCVVLGLAPTLVFRLLRPVTQTLTNATAHPAAGWTGVDVTREGGAYAPALVVAGLLVVGVLPWLLGRLVGGRALTRVAPTWVCGNLLEPRMQYTATAFSKALRLIFGALIRPQRTVVLERPVSEFFVRAVRYEGDTQPIYERHLYQRGVGLVIGAAQRVRALQNGSIRAYLAYIFVTLVVVLALAH
jgi:hydrogenase-4 component B